MKTRKEIENQIRIIETKTLLKKLNKDQQDKWKEFKETVKVIGEYEKALWLANELSNVIPFDKLKPICNFLEQEYKTYRSIIYEENIDLSITKASKQDLDRLEQDLKDTEDFLMKRDKYLNDYVKMSISMLRALIKKRKEVLENEKK